MIAQAPVTNLESNLCHTLAATATIKWACKSSAAHPSSDVRWLVIPC